MLTTCTECGGMLSSKASMCPHCGNPLRQKKIYRRTHQRLPNGFGSITKLNRNLRKPYLARVTKSKDDYGRPVLRSLGYYKTYNEAYTALIEFNRNPYDLDAEMSVSEAYKAYRREVFDKEKHTPNYTRAVERAFEQSEDVHDLPIRKIRPHHIKALLARIEGDHAKANLKNFWNRLFDYALGSEMVDTNYARNFQLDPETLEGTSKYKRTHLTFTDEEMRALWDSVTTNEIARLIIIQCYSGWRPTELCEMSLSNVNLDSWYMKGGVKTEAGIGRVVPIHSAVRPLVRWQYEKSAAEGLPYLFNLNYSQYHHGMKKLVKALKLNPAHRPHDPRKHFVTMALKAGADLLAVKHMVGHKVNDVTERAYTERDLEWLRSDIEKIDASQYTNSVQIECIY